MPGWYGIYRTNNNWPHQSIPKEDRNYTAESQLKKQIRSGVADKQQRWRALEKFGNKFWELFEDNDKGCAIKFL